MTQENEGAKLANALDQLFRSGRFEQEMTATPTPPVPEIPTVNEVLRQKLNMHIETFCNSISISTAKEADRRQATNQIRAYFESWKLTTTDFLTEISAPAMEISAVQDLTLKGVAQYVNERLRHISMMQLH